MYGSRPSCCFALPSFLLPSPGIATEMSVWEGVVVTPSDKAYEKSDKDDEDRDTEGEDAEMETADG